MHRRRTHFHNKISLFRLFVPSIPVGSQTMLKRVFAAVDCKTGTHPTLITLMNDSPSIGVKVDVQKEF
jgi:hypothetical protein